jgi:hypothetical protein
MRKLSIIVFVLAVLLAVAAACGGGGPKPKPIGPTPTPPPTTNEVSGVLTDSYGNPITDASLLLNGVDIGVQTDSAGNFTIPDGLVRANERFRLGVRNGGILMSEREFQLGEEWSLEWQLGESDPEGGTVNGLAVDAETEAPVGGALLALFSDSGWAAVGLTGDDGTFEFTGVPAGSYHLLSFADGYRTQMSTLEVEANSTTQLIISLQPRASRPPADGYLVTGRIVDANSGSGVAGAYVQGNSDSGWYPILMDGGYDEGSGGGSTGGGMPEPMTDAMENIRGDEPMPPSMPPGGNWEPPIYQETYTDDDGYFEFPDPFNGMGVYLSANHGDYMPASGFFERDPDGETEVTLEMTPIIPVSISGTVRSGSGDPIEGAYVEFIYIDQYFYDYGIAVPMGGTLEDSRSNDFGGAEAGSDAALPGAAMPPGGDGYDQSGDSYGLARYRHQMQQNRGASQAEPMPFGYYAATTDENGDYDLGEIPSGYYMVYATAHGYLGYYSDMELTENCEDMDFTLEPVPVGTVTGTVTDDAGNPVADALVNATQPYVDPFTFTDENGDFVLDNVPAGMWRVGAYKDGYEARAVIVEINEDVVISLDFSLPRIAEPPPVDTITFTGSVIDGTTNEPLASADIVAVATDDSFYTYVRSDSQGNYTMLIPTGEYNVLVQYSGYEDLYTRVWVDTEWPEFDFYLWPYGSGMRGGPWGGIMDGDVEAPTAPPPMGM